MLFSHPCCNRLIPRAPDGALPVVRKSHHFIISALEGYGGRPMRRSRSWKRGSAGKLSFQLGVFSAGLGKHRQVGISIFHQRKEVLVGCASLIHAAGTAGSGVSAPQTKMRQR